MKESKFFQLPFENLKSSNRFAVPMSGEATRGQDFNV